MAYYDLFSELQNSVPSGTDALASTWNAYTTTTLLEYVLDLSTTDVTTMLTYLDTIGVNSDFIASLSFPSNVTLTTNITSFEASLSGTDGIDYLINVQPNYDFFIASTNYGGSGDDTLLGDEAIAYELYGAAGDDYIFNVGTNASIEGGDGADSIISVGDGEVYGENGNDTVLTIGSTFYVSGGSGDDQLISIASESNTIAGGNGNDTIITFGDGSSMVKGNQGDDTIINFGAGSTLKGNKGNDSIHGGDGDDLLVGQYGTDDLTGGGGADAFRMHWKSDGSYGVDTITDFDASEGDVIQLYNYDSAVSLGTSDLSFDSNTNTLMVQGNDFVVLEGVTSFDTNTVVFG